MVHEYLGGIEMNKIKRKTGNRKNMRIKKRMSELLKDESGMGVVEVVLIILVLVGLALVFKNQITSIANGIYGSIKNQVGQF